MYSWIQLKFYFYKRLMRLVLMIFTIGPVWSLNTQPPCVKLIFHDSISLVQPTLYLADILKEVKACSSLVGWSEREQPNPERLTHLLMSDTVNLGPAAPFGLRRYLLAHHIHLALKRTYKGKIQFESNWDHRVLVSSQAESWPLASLDSLVWSFLEEQNGGPVRAPLLDSLNPPYRAGELSWRYESKPPSILVPQTLDSMRLKMLNPGEVWRGSLPLVLHVYGQGAERKFPFTLVLEKYDSVWVAKKTLVRGSVLDVGSFRRELRDVLILPTSCVRDMAQVEGHLLKQTLQTDRVLTVRHADVPPLVIAGSQVRVQAVQGGITLNWQGFAKQSGRTGDLIQVRELNGNRLIRARVRTATELDWVGTVGRRKYGEL